MIVISMMAEVSMVAWLLRYPWYPWQHWWFKCPWCPWNWNFDCCGVLDGHVSDIHVVLMTEMSKISLMDLMTGMYMMAVMAVLSVMHPWYPRCPSGSWLPWCPCCIHYCHSHVFLGGLGDCAVHDGLYDCVCVASVMTMMSVYSSVVYQKITHKIALCLPDS